ncbi:hypothetical protein LOZ66_000113 [Ophidiomyces ophidiicola]|nr:hypothetical protein LOZ66_000113 [Ophidiomyces ophidiicola]
MSVSRYPAETRTIIDPVLSTGNVAYLVEANVHEMRPRANPDGTFSTAARAPFEPRRPPGEPLLMEPKSSYLHSPPPPPPPVTRPDGPALRPRSNTTIATGARPTSMILPATPTTRPPMADYDRLRSPVHHPATYYPSEDADRHLPPQSASARRRTISTVTNTFVPRAKKDPAAYIAANGSRGTRKLYPVYKTDRKPTKIDLNNAYSYTNLNEEFIHDWVDSAKPAPRRTNPSSAPRPVSLNALDGSLPQSWSDSRYHGPVSSSKGAENARKDDDRRDHGRGAGSEAPRAADVPRRHPSQRASASVHQAKAKPSYNDSETSTDSRGYRIRRDDDGVVVVDDQPYMTIVRQPSPSVKTDRKTGRSDSDSTYAMTGGLLASAGLASGYSKDIRDGYSDRNRSPRRRSRKDRDLQRPSRDETGSDTDVSSADDSMKHLYRRSSRRRNDRTSESKGGSRHHDREKDDSGGPKLSNGGSSRSRVSPSPARKESPETPAKKDNSNNTNEPAPKGILKQPTQKFPEDPSAVREGVAPLKDAPKQGVPPGARWTKIDRRLVNPAALEGFERFEERSDYVIVLRVLSREEIQAYAIRTAEIRARNYRDRRKENKRKNGGDRHYGRSRHSTDSDDEDDEGSDDGKDEERSVENNAPSSDSRR